MMSPMYRCEKKSTGSLSICQKKLALASSSIAALNFFKWIPLRHSVRKLTPRTPTNTAIKVFLHNSKISIVSLFIEIVLLLFLVVIDFIAKKKNTKKNATSEFTYEYVHDYDGIKFSDPEKTINNFVSVEKEGHFSYADLNQEQIEEAKR